MMYVEAGKGVKSRNCYDISIHFGYSHYFFNNRLKRDYLKLTRNINLFNSFHMHHKLYVST